VAEGTLSQTHEVPSLVSDTFRARSSALWQAIVRDDVDQGMPFFFPRDAYEKVKDVADPAVDWKNRLVAAYARDIHAIHAAASDSWSRAEFVSLDVPQGRARWVEPGEEWNKLGYYRVFGSKLRYRVDSEEHAVPVKSLISWRGEWYVVHLSAIR
jgi:hypothetical protein